MKSQGKRLIEGDNDVLSTGRIKYNCYILIGG